MSDEKELDAQRQLAALGQAQESMDRALSYGSKLLGWYSIIVSLVIGALAFLLQLNNPRDNMGGFILIMGLYVVVIVAVSLAYRKLYRSLPVGYSKRYTKGFVFTIVLYAASLALMPLELESWILLVLLGLVVAAPLLLAGIGMVRK
ncbi:hypothetical protein [Glutamicibacter sp. NPDC087344]|uniref:hypothetical protein n=1 Tax=Glutamicibacter sp. NPDC087344 TaxID=3363994 RepID=UPI003829550B